MIPHTRASSVASRDSPDTPRARLSTPLVERSAELSSNESGDASTELCRLFGVLGLRQHPNDGLCARRADEHAAASVRALR